MRAIIVAAGRGTRLSPMTDDRPKCMVSLLGRPLIHHLLLTFRQCRVDDITIVAGYRADAVQAPGCAIRINDRYASTNMVATLFSAVDILDGSEDVIVSYGDIVFEPRILRSLIDSRAPIAITVDQGWNSLWKLRMADPLADAESLKVVDGGRIIELGRKTRSYGDIEGQYMGLFKVRADHVAAMNAVYAGLDPDGSYDGQTRDCMYMTTFLQLLIDAGWRLEAVPVRHGWLEVDTVSDLRLYEDLDHQGRLDALYRMG